MISFKIIRAVMRALLFFVFRLEVRGRENLPKDTGAIVAINHRSNWDAVVLGATAPRPLGFMAKAELFKYKISAAFFKALGSFPVQRGKGDISAIKAALSRLRNNEIVAMFPEGTRVRKGQKVEPKQGAVVLATRAQVPIVPINISGKYKWMSKITVTYGEPIYYTQFADEKPTVEQLHSMSIDLMNTIMSLSVDKEEKNRE
ncbi:MAG: 1-acyl-sn-glycerol-3-phosphate acyltransferase [Clostridia bacterium]|nr:1-acyl-sn-glycerol-3-phosphate acyltransferase [Clostridia bacterium]